MIFSFIFRIFWSMLVNYIFINFPDFLVLLISKFIVVVRENMFCMISALFNLLRLILWPVIWFYLENVACTLKEMCIPLFLDGVFYMSLRSCWFIVLFKSACRFFLISLDNFFFFIHISMLFKVLDMSLWIIPFSENDFLSNFLSQILVLHCWLYFTLLTLSHFVVSLL